MSDDEKDEVRPHIGVPPEILQVVKALNEALSDEPSEEGCVSWAVDQHVEEACRLADSLNDIAERAAHRAEVAVPKWLDGNLDFDPLLESLHDVYCNACRAAELHLSIGQLKLALVNHDKEWADA